MLQKSLGQVYNVIIYLLSTDFIFVWISHLKLGSCPDYRNTLLVWNSPWAVSVWALKSILKQNLLAFFGCCYGRSFLNDLGEEALNSSKTIVSFSEELPLVMPCWDTLFVKWSIGNWFSIFFFCHRILSSWPSTSDTRWFFGEKRCITGVSLGRNTSQAI